MAKPKLKTFDKKSSARLTDFAAIKQQQTGVDRVMNKFKLSMLTLALTAAGTSSLAFAQEAADAQTPQAQEEAVEVISVRGFRRSLQDSQMLKLGSDSIVEAVSAEDIGKLPDVSVAESIARLPGLTAQRLNGRANVISIRGMGEDYNTAMLNGREQVTVNDNRGIEFDQYPSELLSGVVVYKTPDASVMSQGLGGSVDMRTVRPLAHGEQTIAINLRGERNDLGSLNPDISANGYRAGFTYIDQFADDTIGIVLGLTSMSSPIQEERWNAWGYPENDDGDLVLGGAKPYVRSSELKREGILATLEYRPNDSFSTVFDFYYTKFQDEQVLRGIEIPAAWGGHAITPITVNNGLVTEGIVNQAKTLVRNDYNLRDANILSLGWNNKFQLNTLWTAETDLSYSRAKRSDLALETYAGTGRGDAGGLKDDLRYQMNADGTAVFTPQLNYADYNLIQLGAARDWGNPNAVPASDAQDGFLNRPEIEDEMKAIKLSARRVLEGGVFSALGFGVNYSERSKNKLNKGYYLTLNDYPNRVAVPEQYRQGTIGLDFIGMGQMIAYDALGLYNSGIYTQVDAAIVDPVRSVSPWEVSEDILTTFVKLDLDTELFTVPVTGNVGVQVVHTDQQSVGSAAEEVDGRWQRQTISGGDKFTEVLPSLNLRFEVADNHYVRLGAARVLARARMDQLNVSRDYGYDATRATSTDLAQSPWSGGGGNPQLQPWLAKQYDLSYEHYIDDVGYFAAAVFYKDLENFVYGESVLTSFDGIEVDGAEPALRQGYITSWANGEGGEVSGAEVSLSLSGKAIAEVLSPFGVILSASYVDSSVRKEAGSPKERLGGLSKEVYNATFYYEENGWQFRTSIRKRSKFLGEVADHALERNRRSFKGETLVDAQIGYDFSESGIDALYGLSVLLQVSNLTDEPFVTYIGDDERQVQDYQRYGRNFMFGINYKF